MQIQKILNSIYLSWLVLALPSIGMLVALSNGADVERFIHPTGEFAARFMIIAMMLTPLLMLFPRSKPIRWLLTRRRALGVAAFGYAALHTVLYVIDLRSISLILDEFWLVGIWTGWLAFAIFIPLAATSNQSMVRRLKSKWKPLQRWVYAAAVLTLAHWIFVQNAIGPALVHFVPLALLEIYRIYRNYTQISVGTAQQAD